MSRALALLVAMAVFQGCAECEPAYETNGGTEMQRLAASEAFSAFVAAQSVENQVCIRGLEFEDLPVGKLGSYVRGRDAVSIVPTLPLPKMPWVMTHELCHAAGDQSAKLDDLFWEQWACGPAKNCASEAFAYTCELGPDLLQVVGADCPNDTPGSAVFQTLLDVFDAPSPGVAVLDWAQVDVVSITLPPDAPTLLTLQPTVHGGLRLAFEGETGRIVWFVDLFDGQGIPPEPVLPSVMFDEVGPHRERYLGRAETDAGALSVLSMKASIGGVVQRLVHQSDAGLSRVACRREGEEVFASQGELWSAWTDAGTLSWGRWQAQSP